MFAKGEHPVSIETSSPVLIRSSSFFVSTIVDIALLSLPLLYCQPEADIDIKKTIECQIEKYILDRDHHAFLHRCQPQVGIFVQKDKIRVHRGRLH
jgi:hypothetical protein